jgi:hypothetical protein
MGNTLTSRRSWQGLVLVLVAALAAVSCGGGTAGSSNSIQASLTLNNSSLDFGNVSVGSSKSDPITLTNSSASGGPNITLTQISITGSAFSGNIPTLPLVLAPGQSSTLTITFAPKSAGAASGSLSVLVDGVADPAAVPLTGTGVAAGQLAVSPTTMNFGSVTVGSSKSLTGTLTAGSSSITVSSASWSGQGYSVSGITFPTTVPAGQSVTFIVKFAPQTSGSSTGSVSFVSNASNSPTIEALTGTGTQTTQHSVSLTWDPSISAVVGYNIYRSTVSGSSYVKLNSSPQAGTSYTDSTVQSGTTYFYIAKAVDSSSQESVPSNEATAPIP